MNFIARFSVLPLILVTLAGCGCGGGSASRPIAEFNSRKISEETYLKRLETMANVRVVINGQTVSARVAEPLSQQALRVLLSEQAILQAAQDEGVEPSKDDVERRKDLLSEINPNYISQQKEFGLTNSDINWQIRMQLANENLVKRGVDEKTLEDIEEFIRDNPEDFIQPATVTMRWIVVDSETKRDEVDRDLGQGLTFGHVASERSIVRNADRTDGSYPATSGVPVPVAINRFAEDLRTVVEKTAEREISDWFDIQGQHVKIYIESKVPEQKVEPTAAQKELMRIQLTVQEGRLNNNLNLLVTKKLMDANVTVHPPYLRKMWNTFTKRLGDQLADLFPERAGEATPAGGGVDVGGEPE
ncbi:MAG: SurA N-terminal domain-containing protein [Armatimonadetes bacterium]|nr:SurA N-terminal domain-containing protein [Armatimonadota bacterium]